MGSVMSGLINNIPLISKQTLVPHCIEVEEMGYIAYITEFVVDFIMDNLCDQWVILFALSLLFYAPLTYVNKFSLMFICMCYSLHLWYKYSGREALDVVVF